MSVDYNLHSLWSFWGLVCTAQKSVIMRLTKCKSNRQLQWAALIDLHAAVYNIRSVRENIWSGTFSAEAWKLLCFTCNVCLFCGISDGALMFPWYLLCIPSSIFGPETSNTVSALLQSRCSPVRPQALAVLCNHPELTFPEGTGKPRHGALFSIMSMFIKAPRCAGWGCRIHEHTHPSTHPC